jgi:hypothetical protein
MIRGSVGRSVPRPLSKLISVERGIKNKRRKKIILKSMMLNQIIRLAGMSNNQSHWFSNRETNQAILKISAKQINELRWEALIFS